MRRDGARRRTSTAYSTKGWPWSLTRPPRPCQCVRSTPPSAFQFAPKADRRSFAFSCPAEPLTAPRCWSQQDKPPPRCRRRRRPRASHGQHRVLWVTPVVLEASRNLSSTSARSVSFCKTPHTKKANKLLLVRGRADGQLSALPVGPNLRLAETPPSNRRLRESERKYRLNRCISKRKANNCNLSISVNNNPIFFRAGLQLNRIFSLPRLRPP